MKRLLFDNDVFEENAGKYYRKCMNYTMPSLFLAAIEIAFINTGHTFVSLPIVPRWIVIILTVGYIIPGIFAFPTAWFLRSGKTRLYKESVIEVENKKITYHKCTKITVGKPYEVIYEISHVKKVEKSRKKYVVFGKIRETGTGNETDRIDIPNAFSDMDQISQTARYR